MPLLSLSLTAGTLALAGCGWSAPSGPAGGSVPDAGDQHCIMGGTMVTQHVGMCLPLGTNVDGGAAGSDAGTTDYGPTLYNNEGYDDDCKYHVSWTSTPIRENQPVTFTVTVVGLDPAGPATGADVQVEAYWNAGIAVPPNTNTTTTESPPGSYEIGPVVFNKPGSWTVRFHMFETCSDAPEDSPHGHAAFFVDVP